MCLLILLIIFLSLRNRSNTLPARRVAFNKLLVIIAFVCVSDVLAWYFSGQDIPGARAIIQITNLIYDGAITWAGYAWLCYVELRIRSLDYNYRKRRFLTAIPLIVMLLLLLTNPMTNLLFSIDEHNVYARGSGIFLHWLISWFYLVYATVQVMLKINTARTRVEREQYTPMLWFIVPPAVAAVLQMYLYGMTSTQCGMTLSCLIIAINFMVDEVSKDSLTGLNNRRALEISVIERLQRENERVTVLMCDVDKFKTINDTLGHTAGDIVLKTMAEALNRACSEGDRNLFLCRYGGDEFVIYGMNMEREEIDGLISGIERCIGTVREEFQNGLDFGISVGEATGICSTYEEVEALISMADAIMYEKKQAKKVGR